MSVEHEHDTLPLMNWRMNKDIRRYTSLKLCYSNLGIRVLGINCRHTYETIKNNGRPLCDNHFSNIVWFCTTNSSLY